MKQKQKQKDISLILLIAFLPIIIFWLVFLYLKQKSGITEHFTVLEFLRWLMWNMEIFFALLISLFLYNKYRKAVFILISITSIWLVMKWIWVIMFANALGEALNKI